MAAKLVQLTHTYERLLQMVGLKTVKSNDNQ
jgi:hypothetical protein